MTSNQFFVYIATNKWNSVLYTGMSNNPKRRLNEHLSNHLGFARKYNICKIVYLEQHYEKINALKRERQIKGLTRLKKLKLIWEGNPNFEDLTTVL